MVGPPIPFHSPSSLLSLQPQRIVEFHEPYLLPTATATLLSLCSSTCLRDSDCTCIRKPKPNGSHSSETFLNCQEQTQIHAGNWWEIGSGWNNQIIGVHVTILFSVPSAYCRYHVEKELHLSSSLLKHRFDIVTTMNAENYASKTKLQLCTRQNACLLLRFHSCIAEVLWGYCTKWQDWSNRDPWSFARWLRHTKG